MAQQVKDLALHCCSSSHFYGMDLISGLETSTCCCRHGQKKKEDPDNDMTQAQLFCMCELL